MSMISSLVLTVAFITKVLNLSVDLAIFKYITLKTPGMASICYLIKILVNVGLLQQLL